MNKNTKRVLSAITIASLSVTSFTGNIQNVVNAKEDKQEENALSTNRVNAEVLENEAGAVIRVSASSNVQNVKTTYSVDTAGSKVVSFGDLKAGEVREIQVNFEEDSNKLKSLPKTTAVSDRVDFNKEVRGHKIKGSVSFEYDNGDTAPTVTPRVPTEPTKPVVPVVTTPSNPTAPTNPVATPTEPTTPTKPTVTPTVPTTPINPNAKKVNLEVNVHVTLNGQPRVFTVDVYKNVDAGTKVSLEYVREVLKEYNFVADKLEGFPAVLDKDYAIDVDVKTINTVVPTRPMIPLNPTKPVTPARPLQPVIPDTPDEPVVTPEKPGRPVAPVVTPTVPTTPTKPVVTPIKPNVQRVNLDVNVHVIQRGVPRVLTVGVYQNVDAGTKVSLEYVKEVLKQYDYEVEKLEGFPAVLDKDYAVDVDAIYTKEPKKDEPKEPVKPVTPAVTPTEPTTPTKPVVTPIKPNVQRVNLDVNVHVIQRGVPRVLTVGVYQNVDAGTKVSLEYVKEVLKQYDYEVEKLEGFPAVLDKDYAVDVDAIYTKEPKKDEPKEPVKPVTPAVTPADTGLEAGMPANVKWSRAQLKDWGFTFGKITGNYNVDGDLGVFDNDDALDPAYRSGIRTIDNKIVDGTMSFDDAEKNTPHGYAWYLVTKPDGTDGYAMYLYGTDGKFNDGQKAR